MLSGAGMARSSSQGWGRWDAVSHCGMCRRSPLPRKGVERQRLSRKMRTSTRSLRGIHRLVRGAEQRLGVVAVARKHRDAEAGTEILEPVIALIGQPVRDAL